jgi:hypothetical protein
MGEGMESAPTSPVPWARILRLRGEAPPQIIFEPGAPARVVVGSDTSAGYRCPQPQVAPRQLDVVWDGANLWLEDALRLGRTYVNGKRLNEWVPVLGTVLVSFGPVRLWMAARGQPPRGAVPDYAALERARLTEAHLARRTLQSNTGRITLPPELLAAGDKR